MVTHSMFARRLLMKRKRARSNARGSFEPNALIRVIRDRDSFAGSMLHLATLSAKIHRVALGFFWNVFPRCACHDSLSLSVSHGEQAFILVSSGVAKRRSIMTIDRTAQVFREAIRLTWRILGVCVEHNSFALRKLARAESSSAKSHASIRRRSRVRS